MLVARNALPHDRDGRLHVRHRRERVAWEAHDGTVGIRAIQVVQHLILRLPMEKIVSQHEVARSTERKTSFGSTL
eukprot:12130320-Heterocapsa_arctica.AAC.1